ncbi:MAG TPA: 7TM diverse intracellular signaling domain-containing protein [Bacteroidia bacterium]|jgi:two-component system NtrC family sensor kinase|nr:7TM diverse intracellular signaling domain-containing protein [Bacteroidia bacterium]
MRKYFYLFCACMPLLANANTLENVADTIFFADAKKTLLIGNSVKLLEDPTNKFSIKEVMLSADFKPSNQDVPNLGVTSSSVWVQFNVKNNTDQDALLIELANPILDEVELYTTLDKENFTDRKMGEYERFSLRDYDHPSYVFNLHIPKNKTALCFLKIKSKEQIVVPIKLGSSNTILDSIREKDLLFGVYAGIMLVMFFYNAFVYLSTRDRSYLYYIVYILFVGLTQSCFQGYTFQFLWPNSPWLADHSVVLLSAFVGISAAEFARLFLNTQKYLPGITKILYIFYASYIVCIILAIAGKQIIPLVDMTALLISFYLLGVAIMIARKGYRPAKFFLTAWLTFLIGVIVFALKNMGVLPYNNLTIYTMPAGSAIEAILLSIALADRINILKMEKEESQTVMVLALQENEQLIKRQNIVLEQKVNERTIELKETNNQLSVTLTNLKDAQTQLINAEKMASLGQLTAGIAHEINNPINFVSANLKPLKMDVEDIIKLVKKYEEIKPDDTLESKLKEIDLYKKEIDLEYLKREIEMLIAGIEDGAKRTTEIVSGLKTFSRLDESEVKEVNINDGIESTLTLLKYSIPKNVEVIKRLEELPLIECLPGKLNQVFMNVISNAIYAIGQKKSDEKHKLIIKSYIDGEYVCVSFEDTGIGMTQETRDKIFEPFFTTKDVGEGTGLGMSIVFKIIETHHAKIEIDSEYGKGTKIVLVLNKKIGV